MITASMPQQTVQFPICHHKHICQEIRPARMQISNDRFRFTLLYRSVNCNDHDHRHSGTMPHTNTVQAYTPLKSETFENNSLGSRAMPCRWSNATLLPTRSYAQL